MADEPSIIMLILVAGGVTYLLRAAPVLFLKRGTVDASGRMFRMFEYAAYAVIGGLISSSIVKLPAVAQFSLSPLRESLLRILAVGVTFALAVKVRQPIVCLAAGLMLFFLLRFVT